MEPERTEKAPADPTALSAVPFTVAPDKRRLFLIAGGAVAGLVLLGAVLVLATVGPKSLPKLPSLPSLVAAKPTGDDIFQAYQRRLQKDCSMRALALKSGRSPSLAGLFGGKAEYQDGGCVFRALGVRSTMRLLEIANLQCSGEPTGYDCTFMVRASFKQNPPTPLFARMFGDMIQRGQAVVWKDNGVWQVRPVKVGSR